MADIIYGQTDDMADTSNKLTTFSSDLEARLNQIRNNITTIADATKGKSSPALLDNYEDLDLKLKQYVEELEVYGSGLQQKANDFEEVDAVASASVPTYTLG
ncbi:MAG: WXG100 family type VII secretion target [Pseudobutyrivibrio sp.]|nr:WXG100 family type VII secretion target [Pseudobutyrivibrio sp.]